MAEHQQYGHETLGDLITTDAAHALETSPSVVGSPRRGTHLDTTMLRGGQGSDEVTIPGSAPENPFAAPHRPSTPALIGGAPVVPEVVPIAPVENLQHLIADDEAASAATRVPTDFTPPIMGEGSEAWNQEEESPPAKVGESLRNGVGAIGRAVTAKAVALGRKIPFAGNRKPQPETSIWEQAKQGPDIPTTPLGVVERGEPAAQAQRRRLGRRFPSQQNLDNSRWHDRGDGNTW